jgi:hypothetical protein
VSEQLSRSCAGEFLPGRVEKMSTRTLNHGVWWWIVGAMSAAVAWIISASVAAAAPKVIVHAATRPVVHQAAIGPADAPVRMAVFTSNDREQLKVEPAHWGWGGYRAPYYAYYPAPYYYASPYYSAPYYSGLYVSSYAPPTYYSATPYVSYYPPYYQNYAPPLVVYRAPRRAFYGAWYW